MLIILMITFREHKLPHEKVIIMKQVIYNNFSESDIEHSYAQTLQKKYNFKKFLHEAQYI